MLLALCEFGDLPSFEQNSSRDGSFLGNGSQPLKCSVRDMGYRIRRGLDNLSLLHHKMLEEGFADNFRICRNRHAKITIKKKPTSPIYKRVPSLRREHALSGRPGLDPRLLQLESLLSFNILETGRFLGGFIQKRFYDECSPYVQHQKGNQGTSTLSRTIIRSTITQAVSQFWTKFQLLNASSSLTNIVTSYVEIFNLLKRRNKGLDELTSCKDEEHSVENSQSTKSAISGFTGSSDQESLSTTSGTATDSCSEQDESVILISRAGTKATNEPTSWELITKLPRSFDLVIILKQLRVQSELKYETEEDGPPISLVTCLHVFEALHRLTQDPTTNSIWNIDSQQHRTEYFGLSDIGISYRQKCICDGGTSQENFHKLDVYCPRNQSLESAEVKDDTEKDSEEITSARPPSPAASDSNEEVDTDENEDEGEDDTIDEAAAEAARVATMNEAMQKVTDLVGLHNVKTHMSNLKALVEASGRTGVELKEGRFGTVFLGNGGTGKTTVARNYAKFLSASGIAGGNHYRETTGTYLADRGVPQAKQYIKEVSAVGGVLFVDDAHQLKLSEGEKVLAYMLEIIETRRNQVVLVLAGREKGMRGVLGTGHDNVRSLMPYTMKFQDFTDNELIIILKDHIGNKFGGKMKLEGGFNGAYVRIAARRIGKNRGSSQFGNARAVECLVADIWERQSTRLDKLRQRKEEVLGGESHASNEPKTGQTELIEDDESTHSSSKNIETNQSGEIGEKESTARAEVKEETLQEPSGELVEVGCSEFLIEDDPESDYFFTKEDILGPSPTDAILTSEAWKKLQRLTGLQAVKESILNIFELSKTNYQRELEEKPLLKLSFNRLFLGPPGTGKTVVAKLYGQILADIGVLSKGEVIVRNPSDLIGQYIGDSEANTKAALSSAMGNVLLIDEAYMMYIGSSDGTGNESDQYRRGIIDTLVAEVQGVPGEDRCVLLLGYEDQMREMLQNANPGLARRFPIEDALWFHNFTLEELECILQSKLEDNDLEATEEAIKVAMEVLDKGRQRLNFGNGGEVENLINKAKANYQKRLSVVKASDRPAQWIFQPEDFDPGYDRGRSATLNLHKLFKDVVGCETMIKKLEQYQKVAQAMKEKNVDFRPFIPTNFVFKGPPGTGKTTTARKIAQVYYDMGFLSEASVVECSASDLMGKYVGHTGPKTIKVLERSLGKVLVIDEAYRLAKEGCSYAPEVISELVDSLTKPKFQGKLIVILAGYEDEINHLLGINPGLASRFPEELIFPSLTPEQSLVILKRKLAQTGVELPVMAEKDSLDYLNVLRLVSLLAQTPSWGNAREVETLAKLLCRETFMNMKDGQLVCETGMLTNALESLLVERRARRKTGRICK